MQFTRNWGTYDPIEKGSPGGTEAPTGDNRKKNIFNIADIPEKVKRKRTGPIYGATVYFKYHGVIVSGIVTGEFCPCIAAGRHYYRVTRLAGDLGWFAGQDLYRTEEEARAAERRRERWKRK